jgi:hypothetical protein
MENADDGGNNNPNIMFKHGKLYAMIMERRHCLGVRSSDDPPAAAAAVDEPHQRPVDNNDNDAASNSNSNNNDITTLDDGEKIINAESPPEAPPPEAPPQQLPPPRPLRRVPTRNIQESKFSEKSKSSRSRSSSTLQTPATAATTSLLDEDHGECTAAGAKMTPGTMLMGVAVGVLAARKVSETSISSSSVVVAARTRSNNNNEHENDDESFHSVSAMAAAAAAAAAEDDEKNAITAVATEEWSNNNTNNTVPTGIFRRLPNDDSADRSDDDNDIDDNDHGPSRKVAKVVDTTVTTATPAVDVTSRRRSCSTEKNDATTTSLPDSSFAFQSAPRPDGNHDRVGPAISGITTSSSCTVETSSVRSTNEEKNEKPCVNCVPLTCLFGCLCLSFLFAENINGIKVHADDDDDIPPDRC